MVCYKYYLKKNNLILLYSLAGSCFYHRGTFEVTKNEQSSSYPNRQSALKVTVPPDLEGGSYFQVKTQKGM